MASLISFLGFDKVGLYEIIIQVVVGIMFVFCSAIGFKRTQRHNVKLQSIPVPLMFLFDIALYTLFIAYMNNNIYINKIRMKFKNLGL